MHWETGIAISRGCCLRLWACTSVQPCIINSFCAMKHCTGCSRKPASIRNDHAADLPLQCTADAISSVTAPELETPTHRTAKHDLAAGLIVGDDSRQRDRCRDRETLSRLAVNCRSPLNCVIRSRIRRTGRASRSRSLGFATVHLCIGVRFLIHRVPPARRRHGRSKKIFKASPV